MLVTIDEREVSLEKITNEDCIDEESKMYFISQYVKKALQKGNFGLLENAEQNILFSTIASPVPEKELIEKSFVICNKIQTGIFLDWFEQNRDAYNFTDQEEKFSLCNNYLQNIHCNGENLAKAMDFFWQLFKLIKKINLSISDSIGFIACLMIDRDEIRCCKIMDKINNKEFILQQEILLMEPIINEINQHT